MAVKIGHASSSETGKISGGAAGDQSGKEVYVRTWYKHSKGWVTLRFKDPLLAEYAAEGMEMACANDNIGYDQSQNQTLWNEGKNNDFNPSKITKKVETDCARLVRFCVQYAVRKAGLDITIPDFYTATLVSVLMSTGLFEKLTESKYNTQDAYLERGMIQCTKTKGHTWIILSNGSKATVRKVEKPEAAPVAPTVKSESGHIVKVTGDTVNIRTGPGTQYTAIEQVKKGDVLEVPKADGWTPIKFGGHVYWISDKYTELVKEG